MVATRAHVDVVGLADLLAEGAATGLAAALSCGPSRDPTPTAPSLTQPTLSFSPAPSLTPPTLRFSPDPSLAPPT